MTQRRLHSFVEIATSVFTGYVLSVGIQVIVFPLFGVFIPISDNLLIGVIFTVASLIRGYYFRRLFNWLHVKGYLE